MSFVHLHVHSHYSLLDGATHIKALVEEVKKQGSPAVALTDHGNMHGIVEFVLEARKAGIKPIIGCEFYLTAGSRFDHTRGDKTYHQLLLAYNSTGYQNLIKLSSLAFVEGFYGKPRIDKELLKQYSEGLIATSCCLAAEIPQTILSEGKEAARKKLDEWIDIFGPDRYYLEMQRHGTNDHEQQKVNAVLAELAKERGLKLVATNDVHYLHKEDAKAHDILLSLQTGARLSDKDRFRFDCDEYYLKTPAQMARDFEAYPEALENTLEIADRVEDVQLERDVLLPHFPIPSAFKSPYEYLRHLTYEGARRRYETITPQVEQRIEKELAIIHKMGFEGYFLIVQDFIQAARERDVMVGPGRGSVVGSAVAYCLGISDVDPLRYDLLFERFLNPERISMPDIDIDFEDALREVVIRYVAEKYGHDHIGQIVTYGVMKARSAVRDVARVLELPLKETDRLAKLIPSNWPDDQSILKIPEIKKAYKGSDPKVRQVIEMAEKLKGTIRLRGTHAAGVIIAPGPLMEYLPVWKTKDSDLVSTQYDMKWVEKVGMLKMDFLGLRTLSVIKEALRIIKARHGVNIDLDAIPLDDPKTFELYQQGDTIGTFQFESGGMRRRLKELKPTSFDDLIAMNALYRPGPMDFIPVYIRRKHGKEKVEYPHPLLEEVLKPTYGIFVYQEQIMQAAQVVAGFSLGKADILRRAMGKKKKEEMERMKSEFIEGARQKGISDKAAQAIWDMMARFAEYGFNKSHAAAYALLSYRTAYLKANYRPEFMAAVLSNNMDDLARINILINDATAAGIEVLGPDVNESYTLFSVTPGGKIRFGLGAVKGVGRKAIQHVIEERKKNGPFKDIIDFVLRVDTSLINKRVLESLGSVGALDSLATPEFPIHRAALVEKTAEDEPSYVEQLLRYKEQKEKVHQLSRNSLFGEDAGVEVTPPPVPPIAPWPEERRLKTEKAYSGFYFSGHPMAEYEAVLPYFTNITASNLSALTGRWAHIAGVVEMVRIRRNKRNERYAAVQLEDLTGRAELMFFGEFFQAAQHLLKEGELIYVEGPVQTSEKDGDESYSIRVRRAIPLEKVWEGKQEMEITLKWDDLTEETAQTLVQIMKQHPGNQHLKIILETADGPLRFQAGTGIRISAPLLKQLESIPGITFAIT